MNRPHDISPIETTAQRKASGIAEELLFAGAIAMLLPTFVAYLLHRVFPTDTPVFALGIAFGVYGCVSYYFAERRMQRMQNETVALPIVDRATLLRAGIAKCVAATGALFGGVACTLMGVGPMLLTQLGLNGTLVGLTIVAGIMAAMFLTIRLIIHLDRNFGHRAFWLGFQRAPDDTVLMTRRQSAVYLLMLLFAYLGPVTTCFMLAISWRH